MVVFVQEIAPYMHVFFIFLFRQLRSISMVKYVTFYTSVFCSINFFLTHNIEIHFLKVLHQSVGVEMGERMLLLDIETRGCKSCRGVLSRPFGVSSLQLRLRLPPPVQSDQRLEE